MEAFDLPQRGRRLAYLLTVARGRGAVFIGFYKKASRAKRGRMVLIFPHPPRKKSYEKWSTFFIALPLFILLPR